MSSAPKNIPWDLLLHKVADGHDTNNHNVTVFWWMGATVDVSDDQCVWVAHVSAEPSEPGC